MNDNLIQYKNEWFDWMKSEKRLSYNTQISYLNDLNLFLKFLKKYKNKIIDFSDLEELNQNDVTGWFFEKIKNGGGARSNARSLSSIKSFLGFLKKKKIIKFSSLLSIKGPRFLNSLPRPLSEKQIEKIFNKVAKNKNDWQVMRNLSILFLMWGYGLRINEVLNLKVQDISSSDLIITGKGRKQRIIPLSAEVTQFLYELVSLSPSTCKDNDYIFLGKRGKKLKAEIVQKFVRGLRAELMLPENTTPHSFRHTFATLLLEKSVDLRSIQELLGHASLSTTQKYTKVTSSRINKILKESHPRSGQ